MPMLLLLTRQGCQCCYYYREKDANVAIKRYKDANVAIKRYKDANAASKRYKDANVAIINDTRMPMLLLLARR